MKHPVHQSPDPGIGPAGRPGTLRPGPVFVGPPRHRAPRHARSPRPRPAHRRARGWARTRVLRILVRVLCLGAIGGLLVLVGCGQADAAEPLRLAAGQVTTVDDLPTVIHNATKFIVGILATVATFFLTLGGAKYMWASGDPAAVEQAKGSFRNAGIGYGLAVMAPVFLKILQGILGVQ